MPGCWRRWTTGCWPISVSRARDLRDAYAEPLWRDPTDVLAVRVSDKRRYRPKRGDGPHIKAPSIAPNHAFRGAANRPGGPLLDLKFPTPALPSRPGDPPLRASPRTQRIQRPPALPGGRCYLYFQKAGPSAFWVIPRRSFTTPIGTPNRLIVAIVLPSTTRSQFMWVGAMKKSDSSQPLVARSRLPA